VIRIAISLAAYQAIAASVPEGRKARPPELLKTGSRRGDNGEGVGLWLDPRTLADLRSQRRAGEGYSEVILRLFEVGGPKGDATSKPADVAVRVKERLDKPKQTRPKPKPRRFTFPDERRRAR
jgi:hypothetical protein